MKDGVYFREPASLYFLGLLTYVKSYNWHYRVTPRKFQVHRSAHTYLCFAASVYLPYRYSAQLNTVLFSLTQS